MARSKNPKGSRTGSETKHPGDGSSEASDVLVVVDPVSGFVKREGKKIGELQPLQLKVLLYLLKKKKEKKDEVVSDDVLMRNVWRTTVELNTVAVTIHRINKVLGGKYI